MLKLEMPNLRLTGTCVKYTTASPCAPRLADVELASKHYGSSRVQEALREYSRAEGTSVREDFFWEPPRPRHVTWPTDLLSRKAELQAASSYFAPDGQFSLSTWDEVFSSHEMGGLIKGSSPGYFPRTFCQELGVSKFAGKDDEKITLWSRNNATRLFDLASTGATRYAISASAYRDSQFWCRLLTRHAISKTPKVRSVFDVAYPANAILSRTSSPFTSWIRSKPHPCLLGYDPLTHAEDFRSAVGTGRVLSLDVSKMDKTIDHDIANRYLQLELNQFREDEITRDALLGLHQSLLFDAPIATGWGDVYQTTYRQQLSGAFKIQSLESYLTYYAGVLACCMLIDDMGYSCVNSISTLGDDMFLVYNGDHTIELKESLRRAFNRIGLEVKDDEFLIGTRDNFDVLGYQIVAGKCTSCENKLIAARNP